MRIWLQNFVSIQPRTSLEKSDVSRPGHGAALRHPAAERARERREPARLGFAPGREARGLRARRLDFTDL